MNTKIILASALLCAAAFSHSQAVITGAGYGAGVTSATFYGGSSSYLPGKGIVVQLPSSIAGYNAIVPAGTNWQGYTHLQIQLQNIGLTPQPFFIAIASTGLWDNTEVMLYPGNYTTVIIPLDNAPVVGSYGLPQPPGSSARQLFASSFVDKPNVAYICFQSKNESSPATLLIRDMRPITAPIPTTGIVDTYGQQAQVNWQGKIAVDGDLAARLATRTITGVYPYSADTYGGVSGTAQNGSNTGRWHTQKQNGTWYIVDPLGNRFFSAGVVHAANPSSAIVTGRETAFANGALPSQTGPFAEHYHLWTFDGIQTLTFNFYTANLQRRVGTGWRTEMMNTTQARMRSWAFNTVGANGNQDFRLANGQTTYTINATVGGTYAFIPDHFGGIPMPDVFDPLWATAVQTSLASEMSSIRNPNFNMGMFVDNELPWAKPWSAQNDRYGLCANILLCPATQPAKIQFVQWLTNRYGNNIGALNSAWASNYASFNALLNSQNDLPATIPAGFAQDMNDFTLQFARVYFTTIRQKLTVLGYQGMYMGCRFLYATPEVLQACTESCDVVTYNAYEVTPTRHHEAYRDLDAPVLISEVGFGACDLGRVPFAPNLLTEGDRATFMSGYYSAGLTWPNLVGIHWYKWEDDPISGRYFDGNNGCDGLVSITDVPYWPTVDAVTQGNLMFHKRLTH